MPKHWNRREQAPRGPQSSPYDWGNGLQPKVLGNVRSNLSRNLSRRPHLVGILCGCFMALAIALAMAATDVTITVQDLDRGHAELFRRMEERRVEVSGLLDELNSVYPLECTSDNRSNLLSLLFQHRAVGDIGILNEQRQVVCSTTLGAVDPPIGPNTGGLQGQAGRYYLKAPMPLAGKTMFVTLVERGRFRVALDDRMTDDAKSRYSDSMFAGIGSERSQIFRGKRAYLTDPEITAATPHLRLDFQKGVILVSNSFPGGTVMAVQSVLHPRELYAGHLPILAGALGLCVLLGVLTADAVTRRCRYFRSMNYRIHHLCQPGNVVCHYQPILELNSGRAIGCEVLARLRDGEKLIYPDQFIPALAKQNLGWAFDTAVSARALSELGAALPPQIDFKVALNFFPSNLNRDRIHAHLHAAVQANGRNDLRIELEVTEYNFSPEIVPELQKLQADGYSISIDDFGTGYSNLGVVKRVAPDVLKIDRSFVFEMEDASLRSNLIPEIVAIAKAVNSCVVAEGIENADQANQLRAMGVQYGQGYHFAKPLPLPALLDYLTDEKKNTLLTPAGN